MLIVSLYGPGPSQFIKVDTSWGCDGFYFVIPSNVNLGLPEFELAKSLYSQRVWDKWDIWNSDYPGLIITITNTQSKDGNTVELGNEIHIALDSYENPGHIELAMFTAGNKYKAFGHYGCGGGEEGDDFSEVVLKCRCKS